MTKPRRWRRWITEAIINGTDSRAREIAKYASRNWDQCAIGESRELLEIRGIELGDRHTNPNDPVLSKLGVKFFEAIQEYEITNLNKFLYEAQDILDKIDHWIETHPVVKGDPDATTELNSRSLVQDSIHDRHEQEPHPSQL